MENSGLIVGMLILIAILYMLIQMKSSVQISEHWGLNLPQCGFAARRRRLC